MHREGQCRRSGDQQQGAVPDVPAGLVGLDQGARGGAREGPDCGAERDARRESLQHVRARLRQPLRRQADAQ